MQPVGLANTRISTGYYAQTYPRSLPPTPSDYSFFTSYFPINDRPPARSMICDNWQLVTNEPVSLRNNQPVEVVQDDCRKITDCSRGIYRI